jgi:hypothetical protein
MCLGAVNCYFTLLHFRFNALKKRQRNVFYVFHNFLSVGLSVCNLETNEKISKVLFSVVKQRNIKTTFVTNVISS